MNKTKSIEVVERMPRILTHDNVEATHHEYLPFEGKWKDLVGLPEMGANWLIWGESGSGKTRFSLDLAKYLTGFGKVLYDPLETGNSGSFQRAYRAVGFTQVRNRIQISDREPMQIIEKRLMMKQAADILLVDSLPYTRWRTQQYYDFCWKFRDRMIVFLTHAKGKEPKGKLSEDARYHADIKILVEGCKAFALSRYMEDGVDSIPMVTYEKKAREYWGLDY